MCKFRSMIVLRTGEILSLEKSDSHNEIIKHFRLKEGISENRNFVAVEIVPKNGLLFSCVKKEWMLTVDEESSIPAWFSEDRANYEDKCYQHLFEFIRKVEKTGHFPGNLDVYDSDTLPALTSVNGNLNVSGLVTLPALTSVNGNLNVSGLVTLPALTSVEGNLYVSDSATLTALTSVGGRLDVSGSAKLNAPKLTS